MARPDDDDEPSSGRRRRPGFARRLERICCTALTMFPLLFVYGLTTWACWVGVSLGFPPFRNYWNNPFTSSLVFIFYALANASYTIAVFTPPGSPLTHPQGAAGGAYSALPTHEPSATATRFTTLTTKSSGRPRYCKKCRCTKPDRAHHCSSCGRCVLKMDHHCPWLATCVGMHNYKAFVLFLVYTSLFCIVCFGVSAQWTWAEILNVNSMQQGAMTVNVILLAVLAGIIGLVLSGFTAWHLWLCASGQTTIECLEKTRYLSPVKKSMERQFQRSRTQGQQGQDEPLLDQLKEIHANVLPGVTRPEEGEDRDSNASTPIAASIDGYDSPARESLRRSYRELEQERERERYEAYLDEQDSAKLPNAFDLGWRRNLTHLFGPRPLLWGLPVCNTTGDGWSWDVSDAWLEKHAEVAAQREQRQQAAEQSWRDGATNGFAMRGSQQQQPYHHVPLTSSSAGGAGRHYYEPTQQHPVLPQYPPQNPYQQQQVDHQQGSCPAEGPPRPAREGHAPSQVPLQHLSRDQHTQMFDTVNRVVATRDWNDIPADFVRSGSRGANRTKDD